MTQLKNFCKNFIRDEGGQGMAEYILLLVVVVGLVIAFKSQISTAINGKMSDLTSSIQGINSQ